MALTSILTLLLIASPAPVFAATSSSISSNFNGTPISGGDYIWFNSVLKLTSPTTISSPFTITVTGQTITSAHFSISVPKARITFDPSATKGSTTFDATTNTWITIVPAPSGKPFGDNVFMSGVAYHVPNGGLPGGINPVTWTASFGGTGMATLHWQWGAAVYTTLTSGGCTFTSTSNNCYNLLGVKPLHSTSLDSYKNGDQAGTPEKFAGDEIGGARGGGGSNATGSYSSTGSVNFCN